MKLLTGRGGSEAVGVRSGVQFGMGSPPSGVGSQVAWRLWDGMMHSESNRIRDFDGFGGFEA